MPPFQFKFYFVWFPSINFWKGSWIKSIFGMQMYNIEIRVKFDLGYNKLNFDEIMPPFHMCTFWFCSITFERVHGFNSYLVCKCTSIKIQVEFDLGYSLLNFDEVMPPFHVRTFCLRSIISETVHIFNSYLVCRCIMLK